MCLFQPPAGYGHFNVPRVYTFHTLTEQLQWLSRRASSFTHEKGLQILFALVCPFSFCHAAYFPALATMEIGGQATIQAELLILYVGYVHTLHPLAIFHFVNGA